jgi:hypothetical protein
MAFNFSPGGVYNPRPLDFSALADIPEDFWKGQAVGRERGLRNELAQGLPTMPDGSIDWAKAASIVGKYDPELGMRTAAYAQKDSMTPYQEGMLGVAQAKANEESPDMKLWREWQASQMGAEPMRASPPQPSGVPGMSFQNAPAFITEKFAPVGEKKQLEAEGTKQGERNAQKATLQEVGPGMQKLIDQLVVNAKEADDGTFENALGPLQGAAEAETWQGALGQFFPQTAGAVANYFDKGKKEGFVDWKTGNIKGPGDLGGGYTATLRSKINATSATLISVLQRAQRVPGIGAQSDYELRQIVNQVGELNKSRTKEDFYDRLANVVSNFNNLGIPVKMPTAEELSGAKPTSAAVDDYSQSQPTQEAGQVPYDAAEESPPQVTQGSVSGIPGTTSDPRAGYAKSISKLDGPAIARIRNWAAEAIQAGVPREVVMQRLQELGYGQ